MRKNLYNCVLPKAVLGQTAIRLSQSYPHVLSSRQLDLKASPVSACRFNRHIPGIYNVHIIPCIIVNPDLTECRTLDSIIVEIKLSEILRVLRYGNQIIPLRPVVVAGLPLLQPDSRHIRKEFPHKTKPCGYVSL